MGLLTNGFKHYLLGQVKDSVLHLAFGAGSVDWGTQTTFETTIPADRTVELPHQFVAGVILTKGAVVGVQGTPDDVRDFWVDAAGGVLTLSSSFGTTGDAITVSYRYGTQEENVNASSLMAESCRKVIDIKHFVTEKAAGTPVGEYDFIVSGTKYAISNEPTGLLYLTAVLEPFEFSVGVIREQGIFAGATLAPSVPAGTKFLLPAQIATPGTLLKVDHMPPIVRNQLEQARFQHVLNVPLW